MHQFAFFYLLAYGIIGFSLREEEAWPRSHLPGVGIKGEQKGRQGSLGAWPLAEPVISSGEHTAH